MTPFSYAADVFFAKEWKDHRLILLENMTQISKKSYCVSLFSVLNWQVFFSRHPFLIFQTYTADIFFFFFLFLNMFKLVQNFYDAIWYNHINSHQAWRNMLTTGQMSHTLSDESDEVVIPWTALASSQSKINSSNQGEKYK